MSLPQVESARFLCMLLVYVRFIRCDLVDISRTHLNLPRSLKLAWFETVSSRSCRTFAKPKSHTIMFELLASESLY